MGAPPNANAAIWAIGNGLISTLLVIYLASDIGASGLSLNAAARSWIAGTM